MWVIIARKYPPHTESGEEVFGPFESEQKAQEWGLENLANMYSLKIRPFIKTSWP